ncbi:MAG TPA: RNA-binding protein [Candidatus Fimivivens faecavium]|nr:RNA-binding protein [Candidatus Fimivivens faecavium]
MNAQISHLNPTEKERSFAGRIEDLFVLAREKNRTRFSLFLDERQKRIAEAVSQGFGGVPFQFYGGFPDAERVMLGVFSEYEEPDEALFPIVPVTFRFRREDALSHRDVLGSLMALKIRRETIGDILVGEGAAAVFAAESVSPLLIDAVRKIGRVGVEAEAGLPDPLPKAHRFEAREGVVSSMRLDCIVSMIAGLSRAESERLIRASLVFRNSEPITSPSKEICPGDRISVREYGKYRIGEPGGATKKGRIHLEYQKYV